MKWLIGILLVLFMVSAAFAGEIPYIAIVGNDCVNIVGGVGQLEPCVANPFYFSPKHQQFLEDQEDLEVPVCWGDNPPDDPQTRVPAGDATGCEQFRSNFPINKREICDTVGGRGEDNAVITTQSAQGSYFEWWIRLPRTPEGQINICIQCGVLKPNTEGVGVLGCAAETGERVGTGFCTRDQKPAGVNPIIQNALPRITAIAYPGPYASGEWKPFHLTAYKNPSTYALSTVSSTVKTLKDSVSLQVLDGSCQARVLLKSCMDKCIVVKIPVDGQINAFVPPETEVDLQAGDLIQVRLEFGSSNPNAPSCARVKSTVDVYCHSQSVKIMGIGEP